MDQETFQMTRRIAVIITVLLLCFVVSAPANAAEPERSHGTRVTIDLYAVFGELETFTARGGGLAARR